MRDRSQIVLVVDDEPAIVRIIHLELKEQGYEVVTASDGKEALGLLDQAIPDLILLDVLLPDTDGYELAQTIRERSDVPIIFLTARDSDADVLAGFQQGADDYISKPFSPEELSARGRAVLRRIDTPERERIVRAGNVEIDLDRRLVRRNGEALSLSMTEWKLLQYIAANPNRTLSYSELLRKVWGEEYESERQYLRVWMSRLRRKLEEDQARPKLRTTIPGVGYTLHTGDPPPPSAEIIQS